MFTEERALWIYKHYLWLERHLPQRQKKGPAVFVTPHKQFFPATWQPTHDCAKQVFDRIRELMGISNWPCSLKAKDGLRSSRANFDGEHKSSGAAGTFQATHENQVIITYAVDMLEDPIGYVATMAHELCHYLLAQIAEGPPCTWQHLEPLTDLTSVIEGFGIFATNSHFNFGQWTNHSHQGWSTRTVGYLNEAELGFATAIFCIRNRLDPKIPADLLKLNPREVFVDALDFIIELEANNSPSRSTPKVTAF